VAKLQRKIQFRLLEELMRALEEDLPLRKIENRISRVLSRERQYTFTMPRFSICERPKRKRSRCNCMFIERDVSPEGKIRIFQGIRVAVMRDRENQIQTIYVITQDNHITRLSRQEVLYGNANEVRF